MKRVVIDDIRQAGYCTRGARRWFELHGLDFRLFLDHGISEQELLDTGCALAAEVIRQKKERLASGQT